MFHIYQESKASVNFARTFLTFSQIQDSAELLWTRANGGGVKVVVSIQEEATQKNIRIVQVLCV